MDMATDDLPRNWSLAKRCCGRITNGLLFNKRVQFVPGHKAVVGRGIGRRKQLHDTHPERAAHTCTEGGGGAPAPEGDGAGRAGPSVGAVNGVGYPCLPFLKRKLGGPGMKMMASF